MSEEEAIELVNSLSEAEKAGLLQLLHSIEEARGKAVRK